MSLLLNLPDPILEQILKELDPISLTYISFVCKKLYQESSKDKYWVNLIQTEILSLILSVSFNFFNQMKQRHCLRHWKPTKESKTFKQLYLNFWKKTNPNDISKNSSNIVDKIDKKKVITVGSLSVGKSSLINRFVYDSMQSP